MEEQEYEIKNLNSEIRQMDIDFQFYRAKYLEMESVM